MERLPRHAKRIVQPVVAVQHLIAEIFEDAAVINIGAALRLDGDDAARVPALIRGEGAGFHAKLADAVRASGWSDCCC